MAELCCSVENCIYNDQCYCGKGDICVGGENADRVDETCCESFLQRREDSATNAVGDPSRMISIDCEATKCVYNEDYKCVAEHVDIRGCGASDCEETACATFREQ